MRRYRAAAISLRDLAAVGATGRPARMSSWSAKAADPRRTDVDWAVYETHSIGNHDDAWTNRRCLDCNRRGVTALSAARCPGDEL